MFPSVQFSSVAQLCLTPWSAACQVSLSIMNSRSLLKLMVIESVMPFNHLILSCPLVLLPSIFPSIRVFHNDSVICIRWPSIGVSASASVLGIYNFLDEISSLSHSIVFYYFFTLITEEVFLISLCSSLELCVQMDIFLLAFSFSFIYKLFVRLPQTTILAFCISFSW